MTLYNIPLEIKRVFLSFAQAYFATQHPTLVWNVDPRYTKIFIGDKYALNPAVVERMPSIIFSRGTMAWAQTSMNQLQSQDNNLADAAKKRSDLIRCSLTVQCTSKNGIEAESVANTLFTNLVGYKDQLRAKGIHQILGIAMGEEVPVRGDVESRLFSIPINITFTVQASVVTMHEYYDLQVQTDSHFTPLLLGSVGSGWYSYTLSGASMIFSQPPPSGVSVKATFKGKYTLNQYTNVVPAGIYDGVNYTFVLPEEPYTAYETMQHFITQVSGIAW